MTCRKNRSQGFTIIEVTFAIFLLATALVVLLGLQSSAVQKTLRDRDQMHAMLLARQILAAIESSSEPLEATEQEGTPQDIMQLFAEAPDTDTDEDEIDQRYQARVSIDYWPIPGLAEDAVLRVLLTVYWGELPNEFLEVVYFIPSELEG